MRPFSLAGPQRTADRYPQFELHRSWPRRFNIAPAQEMPYEAAPMRRHAVTPEMNHHAFEDPRCIEPIEPLALF